MFFVVSIFSISVIVLLRFCYWNKCVYVIIFIECAIYTHWHFIIVRLSDVSINMGRLQTSLKSNGKKTIFFVLKDAEVFKSISWVISKSNSYSKENKSRPDGLFRCSKFSVYEICVVNSTRQKSVSNEIVDWSIANCDACLLWQTFGVDELKSIFAWAITDRSNSMN